MLTLPRIKNAIAKLYQSNPHIHVNISMTHPKLLLKNDPAVIKGIYPYVFRIEEYSTGVAKCHTLQYVDVLTGKIEISELENL